MERSNKIKLVADLLSVFFRSEITEEDNTYPTVYFTEDSTVINESPGELLDEHVEYMDNNKLISALNRVVDTYMDIEKVRYEESECPENHIYNDLKLLKSIIAN